MMSEAYGETISILIKDYVRSNGIGGLYLIAKAIDKATDIVVLNEDEKDELQDMTWKVVDFLSLRKYGI